MFKVTVFIAAYRRMSVLTRHISSSTCSSSLPRLSVVPLSALIDQKVHALVEGLKPSQTVTIVTTVQEKNFKFESRGVFKACENGVVDCKRTPSIAGTYTGVQPMGLFWSVIPKVGQRMFKKDVETPFEYVMNVYDGQLKNDIDVERLVPIATTTVERWYKKQSVRRIPLTEGPFKGTVFLPEGQGPFPAVVDLYGGLISLVETRAALLASHGYASLALCYLYDDGMPTDFDSQREYVKEATLWFSQQSYVDEERLGMLGLCYGGVLVEQVASLTPQVKAVVSICGLPIYAGNEYGERFDCDGNPWPNKELVRKTNEGLVIKDIWDCSDPKPIPVWQHGAKVLQISSIDDAQIDSKWHLFASQRVPEQFKSNFIQVFYPGAGHLIDPPYAPYYSRVASSRERMKILDFIPDRFLDDVLLTGGNADDHAVAQEDAWTRILEFLKNNLKHRDNSTRTKTRNQSVGMASSSALVAILLFLIL